MVPDSVAPVTCARIGTEETTARQKIHANKKFLKTLEFIEARPFLFFIRYLKHP